jgi:hypothetical protein
MVATYEDAQLVVQLMRWDTALGLDEALSAMFQESFDPDTAPMDDPNIRKVLTFGETVGALVKHKVLDLELIRDVYWFEGIWQKVAPHALSAREMENEPSLYENFEALAAKK